MLKKLFLILFMALTAASCSKDDDQSSQIPAQDLVENNVEFQLFTNQNFEEERWDDAFFKVEIMLITLDKDGLQSTVFEKTYDWVHFRDFPTEAEKIIEQHKVTYDLNKEVLYASYGIYTRINGFLASEGTSFTLSADEDSHVVEVEL